MFPAGGQAADGAACCCAASGHREVSTCREAQITKEKYRMFRGAQGQECAGPQEDEGVLGSLAALNAVLGLLDFVLSAQLLPSSPGRGLQDSCLQPCFSCVCFPASVEGHCESSFPHCLCVVVISLSATPARLFKKRDVKSRGREGSWSFH